MKTFLQDSIQVTSYLPAGVWYLFDNKTRIESSGNFFGLDAPPEKIPILVRGGKIVPTQLSLETTTKR